MDLRGKYVYLPIHTSLDLNSLSEKEKALIYTAGRIFVSVVHRAFQLLKKDPKAHVYRELKRTPLLTSRTISDAIMMARAMLNREATKINMRPQLYATLVNNKPYKSAFFPLLLEDNKLFIIVKLKRIATDPRSYIQVKIPVKARKRIRHLLYRIATTSKKFYITQIILEPKPKLILLVRKPNPLKGNFDERKYVVGVDINMDRVAIAVIDRQGKLLFSQSYKYQTRLENKGKKYDLVGKAIKNMFEDLKRFRYINIAIALGYPKNMRLLRAWHNHFFGYRNIARIIIKRALEHPIPIKPVCERNTSKEGRKIKKELGITDTHQAAAYLIALRAIGKDYRDPGLKYL
ncbi:MAG: hypothetical protein Q6351_004750 [Candidatus Njordarchaeum guaymaensis]